MIAAGFHDFDGSGMDGFRRTVAEPKASVSAERSIMETDALVGQLDAGEGQNGDGFFFGAAIWSDTHTGLKHIIEKGKEILCDFGQIFAFLNPEVDLRRQGR